MARALYHKESVLSSGINTYVPYFDRFPTTTYAIGGDPRRSVVITDILRRVNFNTAVVGDATYLKKYVVRNGETPDIVADIIYGDPHLFWVLLHVNEILNPYYEWPLDDRTFEKYLKQKYPGPAAFLVDKDDPLKFPSIPISKNDTVFVTSATPDGFGVYENDQWRMGLAHDWDKTLSRQIVGLPVGSAFVVNDGDALGFISVGGTISVAIVQKAVQDGANAVHHFIVDGVTADPLANLEGYVLGKTGSDGITVGLWDTHIGKYLGLSGAAVGDYAVTNYDYEVSVNESKREILVLDPKFLDGVLKDFDRLIKE